MRASGIVLAALITLTSAALIYHRAQPAVKTQLVQYQSGEETVTGYIAFPEGKGPFPAVILIHEWWGLNDWMKANAKKFADRGYLALAIDLYRGELPADQDAAHELMRGLPEDRATRDVQAAFAYLVSHPEAKHNQIGVIGWSMGGGYSLQAAVVIPELAAAVINYGRLITDADLIDKINCPLLGIFGGKDRGIPVKDVEAFKNACKKADKDVTIQIYSNAGHAFINENNAKAYHAKDAKNAWEKTFAFLEKKLKK